MPAVDIHTRSLDLSRWSPSICAYAHWLDQRDRNTARQWALRLRNPEPEQVEGAVAEAVVWDHLSNRVDEIHPGSLERGGPDFHCVVQGVNFYVEVTNISRATVTEITRLGEVLERGAVNYAGMTGQLKRAVCEKAGQGAGLNAPYLVAVTTLHPMAQICLSRAHIEHLLYSRPHITADFDPERGEVVGPLRQATRMELSAFTRQYSVDPARRNVSAVIVASLGGYPDVRLLGTLHPDPVRPFDPCVIKDVPFCRFTVWPPQQRIEVEWTNSERL